jgi:hypothetical protein
MPDEAPVIRAVPWEVDVLMCGLLLLEIRETVASTVGRNMVVFKGLP